MFGQKQNNQINASSLKWVTQKAKVSSYFMLEVNLQKSHVAQTFD